MQQPRDAVLIEKSSMGDLEAFKMLVTRHEGNVAAVIRSMLGQTIEAEDVGQEVFMRCYESLKNFTDESAVRSDLIRIAIDLALKRLKKKKGRFFHSSMLDASYRVQESKQTMDLKEQLHYAFRRLEPDLQAVATLRLVEGYSLEETADMLNIPQEKALVRIAHAQQKLRAGQKTKTMMAETVSKQEELMLHSFDAILSEENRKALGEHMESDGVLRQHRQQYLKIRETLARAEADSFGPFFAERIIHQIKQRTQEIDYLILFFFKKYQVVIIGIVIALLAANIFMAEDLTVKAILGLGEETIEDIISIDVYKNLTE